MSVPRTVQLQARALAADLGISYTAALREALEPYRVVDREDFGWFRSAGEGYRQRPGLEPGVPLDELRATRGPLVLVGPPTAGDRERVEGALRSAGRAAVSTLTAALGLVWDRGLAQFGLEDPERAMRRIVAGRPGSWESALLAQEVVPYGRELSQEKNERIIHPGALEVLVEVLTSWVSSPNRRVEVAETLVAIVASVADGLGSDGWRQVANQWLQPDAPLASADAAGLYRLFYGVSEHYDAEMGSRW